MRRYHKLPSVQRLGPGEVIEKKVDGVDVNDIRVADELYGGRSKRIPRRAEKRNSDDLRTVHYITGRQYVVPHFFKETIQRYDTHPMADGDLRRGQFLDNALNST